MMKDFASEITHVTYKEVMIMWNCSDFSAMKRLQLLRSTLGKRKIHRLTVVQYCKAEDIAIEEFTNRINNYYNSIHKRAS